MRPFRWIFIHWNLFEAQLARGFTMHILLYHLCYHYYSKLFGATLLTHEQWTWNWNFRPHSNMSSLSSRVQKDKNNHLIQRWTGIRLSLHLDTQLRWFRNVLSLDDNISLLSRSDMVGEIDNPILRWTGIRSSLGPYLVLFNAMSLLISAFL